MALGVFGAIPFYWRRHFVVAGAGRLGLELCLALRERGERVVAVEVDEHNANLATLRHHGVRVLTGDATHDVLSSARLHHARGLLAVTREDLVNLNIGCKAVELAQQKRPGESSFRSYVHIYDPQLKATLESALVEANDKKLCNLWLMNSYDMAASAVVRRLKLVHESPTLLIIIGFGRMGQSVLHKVLCPETGSAPLTIRVVDPTFSAADTKIFHKLQSETSQSIERVAIDMRDPALWDQLEPEIQKSEEVRVLVCTDDDVGNLTFAFSMRDHCRRHQRLAVYIRLFKPLELLDRVLVFDGSGDDNQIRIERMYTWQLMMEGLPPELEELLNGG